MIILNHAFWAIDFEFDDGSNETIEGCTDPNAENYNPDATENDGSCTYPPLGELSFGAIDYDNGTLEVNLDCEYDVSSFVFDLNGVTITDSTGINPQYGQVLVGTLIWDGEANEQQTE